MSDMPLNDAELVERLNAHPEIRARIESILRAVENETGDLTEADAAELRLIEEMRRLGHDALTGWAARQVEKTGQALDSTRGVWREGKKNSAGTAPSVKSKWLSGSTVKPRSG